MSNKHRLLLVEDDPDVAEMLLIYFQSQKYEVMHADNGADGIELARTKFPSLILLDVMLPDMDGYEICYQLRKMSLTKYIPTLFLTQKDGRASKVKGLELGADDYITKPFDIDELRLRVENGIRRATRENLTEARSGLPTGELVQEERDKRPDSTELIFTLNGFDSYTDVYSFIAASDALYHAGKTIRDVLSELGQNNAFVGIEDEHFIVLTDYPNISSLKEKIMQDFNDKVHTFYSFTDAQRGGVELSDNQFVPMMSLTTSPTDNDASDIPSDSAFSW